VLHALRYSDYLEYHLTDFAYRFNHCFDLHSFLARPTVFVVLPKLIKEKGIRADAASRF
jgi:hypothetical protein